MLYEKAGSWRNSRASWNATIGARRFCAVAGVGVSAVVPSWGAAAHFLFSALVCVNPNDPAGAAGTLIYALPSILNPLSCQAVFGNNGPVELELGSGDGTFIVDWAARNPARNFLAVERLLGRLRKIDRKGRRQGLGNLRALRIEAAYLMEYLVPESSLAALHIYFPDPWPKRRHWRRRLINERFATFAARALAPDGLVYLRTDDRDYFEQMCSVFGNNAAFGPSETPAELAAVLTDFERDFLARGIETRRAAYKKGS